MSEDKSILREFIERTEGVAQTHYEIEFKGSSRQKTLVVEVDFDLDPSSGTYSRAKIESIADAFAMITREESGDFVSKLKIVGGPRQHAGKAADTSKFAAPSSKSGTSDLKASPN